MMAGTTYQLWVRFFILMIGLAAFSSCSNTKYLEEDQQLYTGARVKLESAYSIQKKAELEIALEEVMVPEPNTSIFGLRPSLWLFNIIKEPKKDKGLRYFIKYKLGNPPVLMEEVKPEYVRKLMENRLYNHGYFNSGVEYTIRKKGKKKIGLTYTAKVNRPYQLRNVVFDADSTSIGRILDSIRQGRKIHTGQVYNLEKLQTERERINNELKNRGYFYFSTEHLHITADSTVGDHEIDLLIRLDRDIPVEASTPQGIRNVYIYPNYHLDANLDSPNLDTVKREGYFFIDQAKYNRFEPPVLMRSIYFKPGKRYSRTAHDMTLSRLMGLGAFKFADVRFSKVSPDSLDAHVYITPMKKKTLRAELELVSKSNNYAGPGLKGRWRNRNTFGGAELLSIDLEAGFETQIGGEEDTGLNSSFTSYTVRVGTDLQIPRFVAPFNIHVNSRYVPKTNIGVSVELLDRIRYFRLNSIAFNYGYKWKSSITTDHHFRPVNLIYSQLRETSAEFEELLENNPLLEQSFSEQFILGPEYSFTYNDQVKKSHRHHFYFATGFDASDPFDLLGGRYSEYVRLTTDVRYFRELSRNTKLVGRLATGIGVAYGESETLPYIKQFFSGGPNGVRAFRARTLGPGAYSPEDNVVNSGFFDQSGDVKLEMNLEYRFKIYSIIEGALFADAGNIWLLRENKSLPGGEFQFKDMLSELAVGVGVGVRIDASFFVLRFDLGWPVRKPFLPEGERWVNNFYQKNPVLNISIGYPF